MNQHTHIHNNNLWSEFRKICKKKQRKKILVWVGDGVCIDMILDFLLFVVVIFFVKMFIFLLKVSEGKKNGKNNKISQTSWSYEKKKGNISLQDDDDGRLVNLTQKKFSIYIR